MWSFLRTNNSKQAILKAVNLGQDTDTIGALTESIAGSYYQDVMYKEQKWITRLAKIEEILTIISKFEEYINKC